MTRKCHYCTPCPSTLGGQIELGVSRWHRFMVHRPQHVVARTGQGGGQHLGSLRICGALPFSQLRHSEAIEEASGAPPSQPAGVSSSGLGLTAVIPSTALSLHSKRQPGSLLDMKAGSRWEKACNVTVSKNRMQNEVFAVSITI